jgi:hypothetical protein
VSAVFALVGIKMRVLKTRLARERSQLGGGWMRGKKSVRPKILCGEKLEILGGGIPFQI